VRRPKWVEMSLIGGLWDHTLGTSEAFRTVSLGTSVNKDKKQEGRDVVPALALPDAAESPIRDSQTVAMGFMFWFTRKRLVGSYSFFISTNLS
jgi:hypothetical protein